MQLSYVSLKLGHLPVTSVVQIRTSLLSATTVLMSAVCGHVVSLPTHGTHVFSSFTAQPWYTCTYFYTQAALAFNDQLHLCTTTMAHSTAANLSTHLCDSSIYMPQLQLLYCTSKYFVGKCMLQLLVCAVT